MPLLGSRGAASITGFGGLAKLGYLLRNSLRFRTSASAYLSRTGTTATNAKTATYSFWMKRGTLSSGTHWLFTGGTTVSLIGFNAGADTLSVFGSDSSAEGNITTSVFRDPAAWYHIVIRINTTEGTAADRIKIYVNGVQQAVSVNNSGLTLDSSWGFNTAGTLNIGRYTGGSGYSDVYLAEVYFIDGGTPREASAFAKTDPVTGQWIPIKYSGTYGNNGFYLNFNDTSNTTAATLGKDSSGNGNNWTPNNISLTAGVTYDAMTDVPTIGPAASNYCVFNGLGGPGGGLQGTLSNGNLTWTSPGTDQRQVLSTMPVNADATGKWYCEITATSKSSTYWALGIFTTNVNGYSSTSGYAQYRSDGVIYVNGSSVETVASYTSGDVIGITFDASNNQIKFYKNNTLVSTQTVSNSAGALSYFGCGADSSGNSAVYNANFGQRPFAYTPPSGFKSLNTFNLP